MAESIEVQGIVNLEHVPLVQIRFVRDGETIGQGQFSPDEARQHAALVHEAAANATYEAAYMDWLTKELKMPKEQAASSLSAMRIWRADKWGQPTIPGDWRSG